MKIGILGWGEPVWQPGSLHITGEWQPDGPPLPIEFARVSTRGPGGGQPQLTLVLHHGAWSVPALWVLSGATDLAAARTNLALREGIAEAEIAVLSKSELQDEQRQGGLRQGEEAGNALKDEVRRRVAGWLMTSDSDLDAVIWSSVESNFEGESRLGPCTGDSVVAYLRALQSAGDAAAAENYVRRAPGLIRTEIRARIEAELGWSSWITDNTSLQYQEWAECRTTIGRLDNTLEDLRKFGFSLVTGLLTATALVGGVNSSAPVLPMASIVIMVLVAALFGVDTYYQVLLSAAVGRALDLERMTDPWIRVTRSVSRSATRTRATAATFVLYVVLLATAVVMGLFGPDTLLPHLLVIAIGLALLAAMVGYWLFVRNQSRLHSDKQRYWPEDGWRPAG